MGQECVGIMNLLGKDGENYPYTGSSTALIT